MTGDKNNFMQLTQGEDSMKTKEEIYQECTMKGYSDTNGTRMDIVYAAMEAYKDQFLAQSSEVKEGVWIKASERLPDVVISPMLRGRFDKGSNRLHFKFNGELFAGRYIQEKGLFKNVFVTAEMDRVIRSDEFVDVEWLDESLLPSQPATYKELYEKLAQHSTKLLFDAEKESCEFAEWIGINNWQADYYMGSELILWSSNKKIPEEISTEQLRNQYLKKKQ